MTSPKLRVVKDEALPDKTRVAHISFRPDREHEFRCIQAIRTREHPAWSKSWSGFRVSERIALEVV